MVAAIVPLIGTLLAQDSQFRREGPDYIRSFERAAPVNPGLRILTRGHVILRGSQGDRVTYKMVQRVKARTDVEAHRLFGDLTESIRRGNPGMTTLVVVPKSAPNVITNLEVSVPRQVTFVSVETDLGDIEAYDLEGNVQAMTTGGMVRCDRIRGGIIGRTGAGEIRLGKIGGSVQCVSGGGSIFVDSTGGSGRCETAGGEIGVREAAGPLWLSTEGGNIDVDRAGSSVEAHSAEGVIDINYASGPVIADTRGGSIQIGSARGAKCESGAGTIRVKNASGPLTVQTAMGSILAELLTGARIENSSLVAGSGDVTVLIPSKLSLSVMARNDTGGIPRIQSDFSEVRVKTLGFTRPPLVYEGSINGGGPLLSINVSSGIIYLKKLK